MSAPNTALVVLPTEIFAKNEYAGHNMAALGPGHLGDWAMALSIDVICMASGIVMASED